MKFSQTNLICILDVVSLPVGMQHDIAYKILKALHTKWAYKVKIVAARFMSMNGWKWNLLVAWLNHVFQLTFVNNHTFTVTKLKKPHPQKNNISCHWRRKNTLYLRKNTLYLPTFQVGKNMSIAMQLIWLNHSENFNFRLEIYNNT